MPGPPKRTHIGHVFEEPVDLAHWKNLPADVKEDEVMRMHAFFFQNTAEFSKFPGIKECFMPNPF